MIECLNLTKRFGRLTALDGVSFEVAKGTIAALLGPNGAGKSTTLEILSGLSSPTEGSIRIAGEWPAPRELLGVLPDELGLFDTLSVEEHLQLTGSVYGLSRAETARRIDDLLDLLDFAHGRRTFAENCSHGMRKKTALSMALLPRPAVLLLDEPFEGLDPLTARRLAGLLRSLAEAESIVLLSSHLLTLVERIADQVLVLDHGALLHDSAAAEAGSLEDLYFSLIDDSAPETPPWLA